MSVISPLWGCRNKNRSSNVLLKYSELESNQLGKSMRLVSSLILILDLVQNTRLNL